MRAVLCLALFSGLGCSPALNWRDARVHDTELLALLPCKPDEGARTVPLAGQNVSLQMTGCDAVGATFAVATARLPSAIAANQALAQWRTATLLNLGAAPGSATESVWQADKSLGLPASATPDPTTARKPTDPALVSASGRRQDGSAVAFQGVWFVHGTQVFHAAVYADKITPEMAQPYFSGLRIQ